MGAEGRRFESSRPDQLKLLILQAMAISATHLLFAATAVVDFVAVAAFAVLAICFPLVRLMGKLYFSHAPFLLQNCERRNRNADADWMLRDHC